MSRTILFSLSVLLALGVLTLGAAPAQAGGVAYTFSAASLGQPLPGQVSGAGGVLFADGIAGGTAGGHAVISVSGQLIFHLHPISWSYVVPGVLIDVCFTAHDIKGVSGFPQSPIIVCLTDPGAPGPVPVTGEPVFMDIDMPPDGKADTMFRITPAN